MGLVAAHIDSRCISPSAHLCFSFLALFLSFATAPYTHNYACKETPCPTWCYHFPSLGTCRASLHAMHTVARHGTTHHRHLLCTCHRTAATRSTRSGDAPFARGPWTVTSRLGAQSGLRWLCESRRLSLTVHLSRASWCFWAGPLVTQTLRRDLHFRMVGDHCVCGRDWHPIPQFAGCWLSQWWSVECSIRRTGDRAHPAKPGGQTECPRPHHLCFSLPSNL